MLVQSAFDQNSADVDYEPTPIEPAWILSGNPCARSRTVAAGGLFTTAIWDCTAGTFLWHYAADEAVHILEGEAVITDASGVVRTLRPGDAAMFAGGDTMHWTIPHHVRKFAVWGRPTRAVARYMVTKAGVSAGRLLRGTPPASDPGRYAGRATMAPGQHAAV